MPINEFWKQWWWVMVCIIACFMFYEKGLQTRETAFAKLRQQYAELLNEEKKALALNQDYTLQINSQSDPEWIELTLMKGLGLVPEDQVKVVFKPELPGK